MPVCAWHAAVFRRLFQVLVSPAATAIETSCEASGDDRCRFVLAWRPAVARPLATARR
jgi:divinyl protochlorophyllide a 8-vinyl-reductase